MMLDRYISQNRVIDLEGNDLESVLLELLNAIATRQPRLEKRILSKQLLQRGNAMTIYLGNGVILPHTRAPIPSRFLFAV
ncbi:MAG: PTS transporter subunit EIIA, partial [Opitutae bacterium]|nr:PTS transporter subunit EIIA [Opitutae bacterium]